MQRNLEQSFSESVIVDGRQNCANPLCKEYDVLIEKLKIKCARATNAEKVKIISLMPESRLKSKVCEELHVSQYLVPISRELTKKHGVLPDHEKKGRKQLSTEVIKTVEDIYQLDENIRIFAGRKDFISVKVNGVKESRQKRLLLCNLKELYIHFKTMFPCWVRRYPHSLRVCL